MLTIRLKRTGRINQPFFRVVVAEKSRSVAGKYIETVGSFNPRNKQKSLILHTERIAYWVAQGAKTSPTVHNMFVDAGVVKGGKIKATRAHKEAKEESGASKPVAKKEGATQKA